MSKSKPAAKKQKEVTATKISAPKITSSAKPIKLGGVPSQGKLS